MLQAINGVFLVVTFFCCRIVWGLWSSYWVFSDAFHPITSGRTNFAAAVPFGKVYTHTTSELLALSKAPEAQLAAFNREQYLPLWLPALYLASNFVLNSLNVFWFGKMIETIRTRFDPPFGTKGVGADSKAPAKSTHRRRESVPQLTPEGGTVEEEFEAHKKSPTKKGKSSPVIVEEKHTPKAKKGGSVSAARAKAEEALNGPVGHVQDTKFERPLVDDEVLDAEVTGSAPRTVRSRRKA